MKRTLDIPSQLARGLIAIYKKYISPLLPPACRFQPTCSQYCSEALEKHGFFKGGWLGMKRLLRCNPFFKGGYDPVPQRGRKERGASHIDVNKPHGQSSKKNKPLQCEKCTTIS